MQVYAVEERGNPLMRPCGLGRRSAARALAWIPAGNVERVSDSERDIEESRRFPEHLRAIRWEPPADGRCGSRVERPQQSRALDRLEPGDVITVRKLDRFGRNPRHVLDVT